MRLLFVSHSFPPADEPLSNIGGMQRVATELHAAFQDLPDVELSDELMRTTWAMTHVKVPFFLCRAYKTIKRRVQNGEVDVVLFSSMVTASLAVWLKPTFEVHGVKSAAIVHGQDVTTPLKIYQQFVPKVFDAVDAIMPVSRATGEQCMMRGLPDSKLIVVPNGVDTSRFEPLEPKPMMRAALKVALDDPATPLPDDALLLCSVGRQVPRKGFPWFAEHVMPLLPENVHYWLAGDGPDADNIRAAAERKGVAHRVRLLGRVTDEELSLLNRGADLFVMPNVPVPGTMEGFGVVMLEAGMCGLPSVAASLEGIRDVITEGVNGHLVPSQDAWAFSEAIMGYHGQPEKLEATSQQTYQHVIDTFSWPAVARQYADALAGLTAKPVGTVV
ncbi:MAG: glycosyltransferase family 4 protein [Rhodothermales bacterium]